MKTLKEIIRKIHWFFTIDLPMLFWGLSVPWKVIVIALAVILVPVLLPVLVISPVLIFVFIMSLFSINKTYEPLYPVEEIAMIEIVEIREDVGLYSYPVQDLTTIFDTQTTVIIRLEDSQIPACIDDLQDLSASVWWNDPSPYIRDGTLRITYQNGSREWICSHGTFYYDRILDDASMTGYYFNDDEFVAYLLEYGYRKP